MNCQLGSSLDSDAPSNSTLVEYWYAVEATVEHTPPMTYMLEREIQTVAENSISWCYQYGARRMEEAGKAYYIDKSGRRLAIMAMGSGPLDQPYSDSKRK